MRTLGVALFFLTVTAVQAATAPPPALGMAISGSRLTVSGVTPHGSVVFFGVAHEQRRFTPVLTRIEKALADDDGDGTVVFESGRPLGEVSVWSAIDLTDGRRATGTASGAAVPLVLADDALVVNNGQLRQIILSLGFCHLLIVRPAVGVWGQVLIKGNVFDTGHGKRGGVSMDVSRSIPTAGTKAEAPQHLEKGDVLVLIDPVTLQVFAAAVGEKE